MEAGIQAPVGGSQLEENAEPTVHGIAGKAGMVLLVIIMLAIDSINPVKVLCSYTPSVLGETQVAYLALLTLCLLCYNQRDQLIYNSVRLFFRCTINNMFFQSVEIVGMENLPVSGPVILTGNHNNQFVDGIILLTNCHREISFMIAQKSFDRPLVGFLARAFHSIPVARPQDSAFKGEGKVRFQGANTLVGEGTCFLKQVQAGAQLKLPEMENTLKVKDVVSDSKILFDGEAAAESSDTSWQSYKVLPKIDQADMYTQVYTGLAQGKCLGIFPEGGSHDRTDILPLKAGVAIIALDAFSKHHIRVPIVPVGLTYFSGHKFGGRAVVEFGAPITIPDEVYAQHETDRRGATEALLRIVSAGMRSVIVPTPNYRTLELIYMARRLYVRDGVRMTAEETNDLNRRFAVGVQKLLLLARGDEAKDKGFLEAVSAVKCQTTPPQSPRSAALIAASSSFVPGKIDVLEPEELESIEIMKSELQDYMATLKRLGIRDHQVRQIGWWSLEDLIGRLLYLVVAIGVGAMPQLLFNLPVMYIAGKLATVEQRKALAASSVKLAARDVLMSFKVIYVLVCIPVLYVIYTLFFLLIVKWSTQTVILFDIAAPFFAFLGMKASEQGIRNYKNLVPLLKRVMQQTRREQDTLPSRRAALQRKLHAVVRQFGPRLGGLYTAKMGEVEWTKEMAELEAIAKNAVATNPGASVLSGTTLSRSASGTALDSRDPSTAGTGPEDKKAL